MKDLAVSMGANEAWANVRKAFTAGDEHAGVGFIPATCPL